MLMQQNGAVDEYLNALKIKSQARLLEGKEGRLDWQKYEDLVNEHHAIAERLSEVGRNLLDAMGEQLQYEGVISTGRKKLG